MAIEYTVSDLSIGTGSENFMPPRLDRKSTRLNSSHSQISYAVFCLKKKNEKLISIASSEQSLRPVIMSISTPFFICIGKPNSSHPCSTPLSDNPKRVPSYPQRQSR